jgi:addiction module HigA family antidote
LRDQRSSIASRQRQILQTGRHRVHRLGITQYRLAQTISVPARRINEIVHGKRAISPDTALRLSRALGTSDRFG